MIQSISSAITKAGRGLVASVLLAWVNLATGSARADLEITASKQDFVPKADRDPLVMVQADRSDQTGTTSLRFSSNKPVNPNPNRTHPPSRRFLVPAGVAEAEQRDRDLGQTFLTTNRGFKVDSIFLRVGFSDMAVLRGARGARVALQFLQVAGTPTRDENGTPGFIKDDFLVGETFRSIHVAHGMLPEQLERGDFLRLRLTLDDRIVLQPHKQYAFMLMFEERGPDRSMSLANEFTGHYTPDSKNHFVGHGIRREGGSGDPKAPSFSPDQPDDFQARIAQQPGTFGFPDVDTFRDLFFTITAVPRSPFKN